MTEQFHPHMYVQPSPLGFSVGTANGPQGTVPALAVETVIGSLVLLLEPDQAVQVGEALTAAGKQAKSGIIVAAPNLKLT